MRTNNSTRIVMTIITNVVPLMTITPFFSDIRRHHFVLSPEIRRIYLGGGMRSLFFA